MEVLDRNRASTCAVGENRLLLDDMARKVNVLFCCLGNICRSPLAEAVFLDYVNRNGLRERFGAVSYTHLRAHET